MRDIQTKRVYEPASPQDGFRVLVDRIWPRGLTKEKVQVDLWLKEIAPSNELRKLYHHDHSKWEEFKSRYFSELDSKPDLVEALLTQTADKRLTLLFSARDEEYNQAVALKEYLLGPPGTRAR